MANPAFAHRVIDWIPIRKAYLERVEKPSTSSLSLEFGVPVVSINRAISDEGWALLRAERLKAAEHQSDAIEVIRASIGQSELTEAARAAAIGAVNAAAEMISELRASDLKLSARTQALGNLCFALANAGKLVTSVGLVGIPKSLTDSIERAGKEKGKDWHKGILVQINQTVSALQAADPGRAALAVSEASVSETPSDPQTAK